MRQYVLKPKYLKIGTLFTGVDGKTRNDVGVIIENDRITKIEPVTDPDPRKYRVYDYSDKFVMPGLMDTYVHLFRQTRDNTEGLNEIEMAFTTESNMAKYLDAGVTYIRILGSTDFLDVKFKKAMKKGLVDGASISSSGPEICMTGGFANRYSLETDGDVECRKNTRWLIKHGVDAIKVMVSGGVFTDEFYLGNPQFSYNELCAIVEEAHAANRRVNAHAQERGGIYNSILAGVDSIEFGNFLDEECATIMAEKGIFFVPALSMSYQIVTQGKKSGFSPEVIQRAKECFDTQVQSLQLSCVKGVTIALGSGEGLFFDEHGDTVMELELLTRYGVSNEDALKAATINAAKCMGVDEDYGSIELGKKADILVLNKNPMRNISSTREVYAVFKDGRRIRFNG